MLTTPLAELKRRSESFAEWLRAIPGLTVGVREDVAFVGGGSLPDVGVPTIVLAISADGVSEGELATRLHFQHPGGRGARAGRPCVARFALCIRATGRGVTGSRQALRSSAEKTKSRRG